MKQAIVTLVALVGIMLAGCSTTDQQRIQDEIDRLKPDDTPAVVDAVTTTTQPPAPVVPGYVPQPGDVNQFLWKPAGEHSGKLVILLPAKITADRLQLNGDHTAGPDAARANGRRQHFRFSHPGAAYGRNVAVVATLAGVEVGRWVVPDGGQRKLFSPMLNRLRFWRRAPEVDV